MPKRAGQPLALIWNRLRASFGTADDPDAIDVRRAEGAPERAHLAPERADLVPGRAHLAAILTAASSLLRPTADCRWPQRTAGGRKKGAADEEASSGLVSESSLS